MTDSRPLAVVTGASTGIGFELAVCAAEHGYNLVIAADEPKISSAADALRAHGVDVEAVEADLATTEGVDKLLDKVGTRPIDALFANAGRGLGGGFLDEDFADVKRLVDTNVTGTLYLVQKVGRRMRDRGDGKILITGSIAGRMPGAFQAVYNGTKAMLDNFAIALRNELKDTGVTVTVLMPGPTETEFFERAGLEDTRFGSAKKDDPEMVARVGFDAMMRGKAEVVSGTMNKVQMVMSDFVPSTMLAQQHRKMAEPGSGHPHHHHHHDGDGAHTLAHGLGWFSIGLGLAEVAAAESLGRALGMERHTELIRAYGVRELGAGLAILARDDPEAGVWSRVAGDALDLATLGAGYDPERREGSNVLLAIAAVVGVTALDVACGQMLRERRLAREGY